MVGLKILCWLLCAGVFLGCERRAREEGGSAVRSRERKERKSSPDAMVETRRLPLHNQSTLHLDLEYIAGYLQVDSDTSGLLADLRFEFENEDHRPEIIFDSSAARPTLSIRNYRSRDGNVSLDNLRETRWRLSLSPQVVLDFRLEAGAMEGMLDFTGLKVENISIEVGAGELDLIFDRPNTERPRININAGAAATNASGLCNANFSSFEFHGGAGKSNLTFSGAYQGEGKVDLKYGVGLNTVFLDPELGARVRKSGSFLAPMSLHGFDKEGEIYYSKNYDSVQGRLDFDIEMGVGHTTVKWLD